jgi:hypothetical protein
MHAPATGIGFRTSGERKELVGIEYGGGEVLQFQAVQRQLLQLGCCDLPSPRPTRQRSRVTRGNRVTRSKRAHLYGTAD